MVVSFVGGGGKTSTIYALAKEYTAKGKRVIITTTTHMEYPKKEDGPLCTSFPQAKFVLDTGRYAICGQNAGKEGVVHKMCGLDDKTLKDCVFICDIMLVEADGAKRKPLKAPIETEPVIPSFSDEIVIFAGIDALNKPMVDVCFRIDRICSLLGVPYEMQKEVLVDKKSFSRILLDGYIKPFAKRVDLKNAKQYVVINKADTSLEKKQAKEVADILFQDISNENLAGDFKKGSAFYGCYITSLKNGECYYEKWR